jgi:hypothetical protein
MGIYDSKARGYFRWVEENLDTPITDRDIYMFEVIHEADGTLIERKTETYVTTTSICLQHIIFMTCEGPALHMIGDNESLNGYESWRLLCSWYKVKVNQRATGRLSQTLHTQFGAIDTIEDTLTKWESELRKYESEVHAPLHDAVKLAIIMS